MYYPKIKVYDVAAQKERYISPVGGVLGIVAVNDYSANESFIPAGSRRGKLLNALGIDINATDKGRAGGANYICENQINPICLFDDTGIVVWGAQTLQPKLLLTFGDTWPDEKWILRSCNINRQRFDKNLKCIFVEISVELVEYIENSKSSNDIRK